MKPFLFDSLDSADLEAFVKEILRFVGDNPEREGLVETPKRVVASWKHLFSGYSANPCDVIKTFENEACDEMVLLKDIEMYSMCEHHMLPFVGRAHIAYIPKDRIVGISKLARILEIFSRRLQNQERITTQITDCIMKHLDPKGAACVIEAKHMCIACRGVQKQNSVMVTSSMRGCFRDDPTTRNEFLKIIGGF